MYSFNNSLNLIIRLNTVTFATASVPKSNYIVLNKSDFNTVVIFI